jgi:cystathionine beta-lyase/cystathionine gamma-synthase
MPEIVDKQSKEDIAQDCEIANYRLQTIEDLIEDIKNYPHLQPENKSLCAYLEKILRTLKNHFKKLEETLPTVNTTCYTLRFRLHQRLRVLDKSVVSLYTNQSWQSPSQSNIFRQGITPPLTQYEYQRMELDRNWVEKKINSFHTPIPSCIQETLVLNSGMGAFSLIMATLVEKMIPENSYICVGDQSYFEIKDYFQENKSIKSTFVKETDIESIIDHVVNEDCMAINLDVISNTFNGTPLDKHSLFSKLTRIKRSKPLYLLLDTTLMGPDFQCSDYLKDANWPSYLHVILYRSLQKFDQFGDDKVSGGTITVIASDKTNILPLNKYRSILGINCPEQNLYAYCLKKDITSKRVRRINRNAELLFHKFRESDLFELTYNQGGLLFLKLNNDQINYKEKYEEYIENCMNKNFDRGLFVIDSNSFGFNHTHIMHIDTPKGDGYIRIAPGMETLADINKFSL